MCKCNPFSGNMPPAPPSCFQCLKSTDLNVIHDITFDPQPFGGSLVIPANTLTPGTIVIPGISFHSYAGTTFRNFCQLDLFVNGLTGTQLNGRSLTVNNDRLPRFWNFGNQLEYYGVTINAVPNACISLGLEVLQTNAGFGFSFPNFSDGFRTAPDPFAADAVLFSLDVTVDNSFDWFLEMERNNDGVLVTGLSTHLFIISA